MKNKLKSIKEAGLIGSMNESNVTATNYKEVLMSGEMPSKIDLETGCRRRQIGLEHSDRQPRNNNKKIPVGAKDLSDLIYYARRYCDGRATYAPHTFNEIYARIRSDNPDFIRCYDWQDETLMGDGRYWPYAQDGMYDEETGKFDARPKWTI